jgi:hypothetical protein
MASDVINSAAFATSAIEELVAALEAGIVDDATNEAVKQAIIDKLLENLPDIDDLSLAAIADTVWNRLTSALTTAGSIGKLLVDNVNATIGSRSSHSAADVWLAATRTLTSGLNIALAKGVGVTGFNDLDATAVQTAVNAALVALHLDHLLAADYDPADKPGVATALLNELVENDGGVSRFTANALEQAPSGGGGEVDLSDEALADIGGLLRGIRATVSQLPLRGQRREFIQGDDHLDANGTGIAWAIADAGGFSDMTDWSVRLRLNVKGETAVSDWCEIAVPTGATRSGVIDWENLASDLTKLGEGDYRLEFKSDSDKEVTLVKGPMELFSQTLAI